MRLEDFARELLEDVLAETSAAAEGEGAFQESVFASHALELLITAGEVVDPQTCQYRGRGMKVDAFDYLDDSDELDLFVTDFDNRTGLRRMGSSEVADLFARGQTFLRRSLDGLHQKLEESSDAFSLAQTISDVRQSLRTVRIFLLTNRVAPADIVEDQSIGGIRIVHQVWDIERLFQASGAGSTRTPVTVDFAGEFGGALPCLPAPLKEGAYDAYLLLIPGPVLAEAYGRWGQRLLERNVRSFLQARGAVNQGIRKTLEDEPGMFLAYNNGISATADAVIVSRSSDGTPMLRLAENLQIVNGGQTTASTYDALRRRVDLSDVYVQMKLTVLRNPSQVERVVPLISRFANSQTKVTFSDFSANDPYHLELERLSREVWAPNPDARGKSTTKWYYERARGQYADDRARQPTPTKRRAWDFQHPSRQRLTKTLIAKYEMTWQQMPQRVSEGAEKNFAHFSVWLQDHGPKEVDITYFSRLVAKAILFQACDRIVARLNQGGYKANVVTYTIAWLSCITRQSLDLDAIWQRQGITAATATALEALAGEVWKHLTDPPPSSRNISEWSKKVACWETLKQRPVSLPGLQGDLVTGSPSRENVVGARSNGHAAMVSLDGVSPAVWTALAGWGDDTGRLLHWERGLALSLADLASRGRTPTPKQTKHGLRIYRQALNAGFSPPDEISPSELN